MHDPSASRTTTLQEVRLSTLTDDQCEVGVLVFVNTRVAKIYS